MKLQKSHIGSNSNKRVNESQIPDLICQRPSKKTSQENLGCIRENMRNTRSRSPQRHHYSYFGKSNKRSNSLSMSNITVNTGRLLESKNANNNIAINDDKIIFDNGVLTPITTPIKASLKLDTSLFKTPSYEYSPKTLFSEEEGVLEDKHKIIDNFVELSISKASYYESTIFNIPEILNIIVKHVANMPYKRNASLNLGCKEREPESFQHALHIYKDQKKASEVWSIIERERKTKINNLKAESNKNVLFNCLLVNKLWFRITLPYLVNDMIFYKKSNLESLKNVSNLKSLSENTKTLTLHKVSKLRSPDLRILTSNFEHLEKLKLHICPFAVPPTLWFSRCSNLTSLSITGNKLLSDKYLIKVSAFLRKLKYLDIRACDNISDIGIISITNHCKELKLINLGRHNNGSSISDISLAALGKYTNVETVGMAGCNITDVGLWEFAKCNGNNVKRLSLNNCKSLTDLSIPYLIGFNYFPNVKVLEIRNLDKITDVKWLVKYKAWKSSNKIPVLIEGCERITKMMNDERDRLRKVNSIFALRDMTKWVNED